MTEPEIVVCRECGQASRLDEWASKRCPNPACYPGMRASNQAMTAWERERDAYVNAAYERASAGRYAINGTVFREYFERDNPRPVAVRGTEWPAPMTSAEWLAERD